MEPNMLKKIKLYTGLVLLAIVLIVVFQNTQTVETKFLFMTMTMPRAALLAITMLIGVFIGILISLALLGKNSQKD
jgi:putative membrane protein